MTRTLSSQITSILDWVPELPLLQKKTSPRIAPVIQHYSPSLHTEMPNFVRIAGLSGAIAVTVGAYGSHKIRDNFTIDIRRKKAFEMGSLYHYVHTLALLAAPDARYPYLTSTIFISGIIMFCGPCYLYSITGNESLRRITPFGGLMFILGWLTFIF